MTKRHMLTLIIVTALALSLIGAATVAAVSEIDLNVMEETEEGKDLYEQNTDQEEFVVAEEEIQMEEENQNEEELEGDR